MVMICGDIWWNVVKCGDMRWYVVMGCDGCQSDPFQWRSILHSRCLSFIKQCRIFPQSSDHNFDDGACIFPFCSRFWGQFLFFLISSTCLLRRDVALPSLLKTTPGCSNADGHGVGATAVEAISGLGEVIDEQLSELLLEELGIPSYGWWFWWVLSFLPKIMVGLQNMSHS